MALTLITGLPGHGKTLYTLFRFKGESEKENRPVFQCSGEADPALRKAGVLKSIPGLTLPWPVIDPMKWHEAPAGAIVIIDEAQFIFPTRGRGEPPEWVARLATHRHLGIDIVLVTQGPMLLDSFVRSLVDRHFDIVRTFGTRWATIHEYPNGVREQVRKSRGSESIRHKWRYPVEAFGWYRSAEVHTVKSRVPVRVWLLALMPLVFLAAAYWAYTRLNPKAAAQRVTGSSEVVSTGSGQAAAPSGVGAGSGAHGKPVVGALEYLQGFNPRVPGLPHTAAVYDEVTKPAVAPYPAACIASKARCVCATQQGTRMAIDERLCRDIAGGGFFIAWEQKGAPAVPVGVQPVGVQRASLSPAYVPAGSPMVGIDGRGFGIGPPTSVAAAGVSGDQQSPAQPTRVAR